MLAGVLGGLSLGAFLGFLIGLSTTPVVSIVITGVVALLAAFFGLSEKLGIATSTEGSSRLVAFGIAATLCMFGGMHLRTNQTLMPSIDSQREDLRKIGYADNTKAQTEMLAYLRYGLLPTGATAAPDHSPGGGVLYARPPSDLCDGLSKTSAPADIMQILGGSDKHLKRVAAKIKALAPERQADVADVVKSALCAEN
jgi:hypothetical protein